jgi:hypothetical protein
MDTDLVIRAQQGDKEAYTRLAGELTAPFLSTANRILREITLAEDATQHALLNIWQRLPQLRDPERFEAWSYRLLVRACYDEGRKASRWAAPLRVLPYGDAWVVDESKAVLDRDQLDRAFRRFVGRAPRGGGSPSLPAPVERRGGGRDRHPGGHRGIQAPSRSPRASSCPRGRCSAGRGGCRLMSREPHDPFTHDIEAWLDAPETDEDPAVILDRVADLGCANSDYWLLFNASCGTPKIDCSNYPNWPGESLREWLIDVNDEIFNVRAQVRDPEAGADVEAEIQHIVDSIQFE